METITSQTESPVHPYPQAGRLPRLPPETAGSSSATAQSCCEEALLWAPESCIRVVCTAERRPCRRCRQAVRLVQVPRGRDGVRQPHGQTPQGVLFVCGHAGPAPCRSAWHGQPLRGAGRGPGPGQRGHDPPHGRRLRRGRAVPGERLRGPLQPQDRPGHHGGGVPLPGLALRRWTELRRCCGAAVCPCTAPPCGAIRWTCGRWICSRCAVAIGSEGRGLSQELLAACARDGADPHAAHTVSP